MPIPGAIEWIISAKEHGWDVYIEIGERAPSLVAMWLKQHAPGTGLENSVHLCLKRPVVNATLDPTAIPFDGKRYPTIEELAAFKPWWEKVNSGEDV